MAVQRKRSFVEGVVIEKNEQFLILETDIYQYPQVKDLILNRDIPPDIKPEFKVYSDEELKRFNAFLAKVDIQTARISEK